MKIKTLLLPVILALAFSANAQYSETWDHNIEVKTGNQTIDGEEMYCYSITVYEAKEGAVRNLVMDQVKIRTEEKPSKKKVMSAVAVDFPNYNAEDVEVKVKTDDNKKGETVDVHAAFVHQGKSVNPKDYPEADKVAKQVMRDLSVILNKSVVGAQIAATEQELELQQKKHESYMKEQTKLEEVPSKAEEETLKLESERKKLEDKLTKAQTKAASLEVAAEASTSTSKDINKYASAKKSVTSLEGKLLKNDEQVKKIEQKVAEAEQELPDAIAQVEESQALIDQHKALLEKLNAKYDAID